MPARFLTVVLFLCGLSLTGSGGCERSSPREDDKGRVNVDVNTPVGNYGVNVEYPKDKDKDKKDDKDDDKDVRIKVDQD